MAKNGIDVTIDNRETFALIERLIRKLDKPEPLLKLVGRYIRAETKKMFVGKRPDTSGVRGELWPKLAKSTIEKKKRLAIKGMQVGAPHRPLVQTASLRDDLMSQRAIKVNKKGLVYGTDRRNKKGYPYPSVHQTGTRDGKVPQRRFLFLTVDDLNQIAQTTREWIMERL